MNDQSSFRWLFLPLILLVLLASVLFIERMGLSYEGEPPPLELLDAMEAITPSPTTIVLHKECLVLYDSQGIEGLKVSNTVKDTLQSMRVEFDSLDVSTSDSIQWSNYDNIVIAFINLEKIQEQIIDLTEWVREGGHVLFAIRPDPSQAFASIYRKLGIREKKDTLVNATGLQFVDDLFPGTAGLSLEQELFNHISLMVQLDEDCHVHIRSSDQYALPILWERNYDQGTFVVINSDNFVEKSSRGTIGAAYSLLDEVMAYPVINSAIFFIDDFPSPIPMGRHDLITKEFGRDLQSFYLNIWWPDMQSFARRYGIRYTGVVIETYNHQVSPPFELQTQIETFSLLSTSLLRDGGELGWHGYNHVPLCLTESNCQNQLNYPKWESEAAMRSALAELQRFSSALAGNQEIITYVPPSNILSSQTRTWLRDALPGLRVIASVFLPEAGNSSYVQEFQESPDGVIELPRFVAGFYPDEYMKWTAINEIMLHYVHSQFVHPDDVLDEERSGGHGWTYLRNAMDDYFLWLYRSVPGIRNMTAREAAMAVQRFYRLKVHRKTDQEGYHIHLENFYDEAYLLMRTTHTPGAIEGGELTQVSGELYLLKATSAEVLVKFATGIALKEKPTRSIAAIQPESKPAVIPVTASAELPPLDPCRIGLLVVVYGTESRGLRVRTEAGTANKTLFIAPEGGEFQIVAGPESMNGRKWWQIQSIDKPDQSGWSVQDFLKPLEEVE